jgi:hypothetical protein
MKKDKVVFATTTTQSGQSTSFPSEDDLVVVGCLGSRKAVERFCK